MSRRIEVELTSRRDDSTWTWRAAGAREPRGVVEASLVPPESKVGDVLRVEIETFIDGNAILAVLPPKAAKVEPQRLELLGPRRPERLVTTTLSPRGRGEGDRGDRGDRPRRPRGEGGDDRRRDRRDGPGGAGDRRDRDRRDGPDGRERRPRPEGEGGERRSRPPMDRRPPLEAKPKAKRLRPGHTHRRELIAALPEEQRPIADELSKGGIPGVRAALEAQSAQAKAEGHPEINPAPLLALAEDLWPRMRAAEWRDRAEAAIKEVDELDLRDLRSVVVAADSAARDEETRLLAAQLREALTRRVDEEHAKWLTELAELVADNRVVAALRRSSRPPKAGAPLPSDLARLLADRTAEALTNEVGSDRWAVLLDALSFSPVRSSVTPVSVPEQPNEELLDAVRRAAARLPHIAALFGIEAPPVPPPGSAGRGGRGGRGGARGGGGRGDRGDRSGDRGAQEAARAEAPTPQAADEGTVDGNGNGNSTGDHEATNDLPTAAGDTAVELGEAQADAGEVAVAEVESLQVDARDAEAEAPAASEEPDTDTGSSAE